MRIEDGHASILTCPLTGRTVIAAPARAARPDQFDASHSAFRDPSSEIRDCPFCYGHESDTPDAVLTYPDDIGGWKLRVVPNKYPAVGGALAGYHEVLIEGSAHEANPTRLPADVRPLIWRAYRERMTVHAADERIACVVPFKNVGGDAGASLEHSHSQILSIPFIPEAIAHEAAAFRDGFRLADLPHVVADSERFVAACPPAPRLPFETWLFPKRPSPDYRTITDDECDELSDLMHRLLVAVETVSGRSAFNWFVHTAPLSGDAPFHWHVELIPRTARPAGFEWATGAFINTTPPEVAAGALREAMGHRTGEPGA